MTLYYVVVLCADMALLLRGKPNVRIGARGGAMSSLLLFTPCRSMCGAKTSGKLAIGCQ
jgi:hypothetical protein